jgi:multisubunit Na+/H+ antiporter MnhB subunit
VLVVGVLVVTVVLALNLTSRLDAGQKVLDSARPAFAPDRVAGARAGINFISTNVDAAEPIATPEGGAAAEVPKLIGFVSQQTGLSQAQVVAALQKNFPHTTALLQAIPLSAVSDEIPGLLTFMGDTLKLSQPELLAALQQNFPHITQAVVNLPTVTSGWAHIKDIDGLTRFNGTPVQSVPDLRTYFSADLIPVLETQQANFASLDGTSKVDWIAPLLLIVGVVTILFALVMIALNLRGRASRGVAMSSAAVVVIVGVGVVGLALAISLVPRVSDGQKLLDALAPANTAERVQGDRAGITMVSAVADTEDPIMTPQGGAAAEVPKLIAFVSKQTGLSQAQVLAALQKNFPHTTALLQAIPLSAVSDEIPGLLKFMGDTLKLSQPELLAALQQNFPHITQAVVNLPAVTSGWNHISKTDGFTRFSGDRVQSMPQVGAYFSADVIPVLETQRANYDKLVKTSDIDFIGPLVLIVGIIVIVYGLLMLYLASRIEPSARKAPEAPADSAATPTMAT